MRGRTGLDRSGKRGAELTTGVARPLTLALSRKGRGDMGALGHRGCAPVTKVESYFFSAPVAAALRAPLWPLVPSKNALESPSWALGWQLGVQE